MNNNCKNCQSPLEEQYRYCPECGQKAGEELTIGILFNNTISNYFSVDSRFFASFIPLLFKPGYLPRKFVEGKRMRYLHPAQFYLFITVIFFFLFSFQTRKQQEMFDEVMKQGFKGDVLIDSGNITFADSISIDERLTKLGTQGITVDLDSIERKRIDSLVNSADEGSLFTFSDRRQKLDSLIEIDAPRDEKLKVLGLKEDAGIWTQRFYIQLLKFYERRGGGLLEAFYDSIPIAMFFLLPLYALFLKLLYFRRGRFAHHLVFSFYFFSFLFTVFTIILLSNFIIEIPDWIDWMLILLTGVYLWIALKRFYDQSYFITLLKAGVISFMYLLFVMPTALVILAIISFLVY